MAELYTGELLFPAHHNYEHLAMMQKLVGFIPMSMSRRAGHSVKKYFDKENRLNFPKRADPLMEKNVKKVPVVEVIVR